MNGLTCPASGDDFLQLFRPVEDQAPAVGRERASIDAGWIVDFERFVGRKAPGEQLTPCRRSRRS